MMSIGTVCIKIAGRDAGGTCVIVDVLDGNYVLIDGNVRRRKCNILHLEATSKKIDIKKGASHEDVKKEFSKLKLAVWETKAKQKGVRPRKIRGKKKVQEEEAAKDVKKGKTEKAIKKETKKGEKPVTKEEKPKAEKKEVKKK